MGKPLKEIYPHATKLQVIRYKFNKFMEKVLLASFLLGTVYGAFYAGRATTTPVFVQAEDKSSQMYQDKIEALKDSVLEKLSACESAGHKESDGVIIMDTNNKLSIGQFQWQISSVKHYYKLMTGKSLTSKEATILALDKEESKKLAKYVAFSTKNKIGKDWANCNNKYKLDMQVDMIKSME